MTAYPLKLKKEVRKLYSNGIRPKLISDKYKISLSAISDWVRDLPKTGLVGAPIGHIPWNKGKPHTAVLGNKFASREVIKRSASHYRARKIVGKIKPCEICKKVKKQYHMIVHHIDENPFNNVKENLMRLCRTCHINLHRSKIQGARKYNVK